MLAKLLYQTCLSLNPTWIEKNSKTRFGGFLFGCRKYNIMATITIKQWVVDFQEFLIWHARVVRPVRGRYFINPSTRQTIASMLDGLTSSLTSALASSNIPNASILLNQFKKLIFFRNTPVSIRLGPGIPDPKFFDDLVRWFNQNFPDTLYPRRSLTRQV